MYASVRMVSVVIPAYNQSQYLTGAIQSVLSQTYHNFEIIVIDDGSTDNTQEIALMFGPEINFIHQENQGLASARNTGILAAKGELIGFLDADDQWLPGYLEKMISLAAQHTAGAVYYCRARAMDGDSQDLPQLFGGPVVSPDNMFPTLLRANFLIPSTIMTYRSVIISAGMFDVTFRRFQDWELWIRLLKEKYRFIGIADVLVRYRIHDSSLSANSTGGQRAAVALTIKHFGADDGEWGNWSWEKRRAYGGVYRYQTITFIQRQNDWQAGGDALRRALRTDPSLAIDIDFFYDLALGSQPAGYRGSGYQLNLEENGELLKRMLGEVFDTNDELELKSIRRQTYGSAYFALGLLAYNTANPSLSRSFLIKALRYRPDLWRNPLVLGDYTKSFLNPQLVKWIKRYRRKLAKYETTTKMSQLL